MRVVLALLSLFVLVPLVVVLAELRPSSLPSRFKRDTAALFAAAAATTASPVVTEADLSAFPQLLQRYLQRAGVVGKPRVRNVRLSFAAQMRTDASSPWMAATATQYEFFDPPARLFFMKASRSGIPFVAYHRYVGSAATFEVRLAGLYPMVNMSGPAMTRSETVTLLNDICLLAPGALLSMPIAWTVVNDHTLHAQFRNAGHTVEAQLHFNKDGDIANFTSNDRGEAVNGTQVLAPWDTPVSGYATFDGVRIVSQAEARYLKPQGMTAYGRFTITAVSFNVTAPSP